LMSAPIDFICLPNFSISILLRSAMPPTSRSTSSSPARTLRRLASCSLSRSSMSSSTACLRRPGRTLARALETACCCRFSANCFFRRSKMARISSLDFPGLVLMISRRMSRSFSVVLLAEMSALNLSRALFWMSPAPRLRYFWRWSIS